MVLTKHDLHVYNNMNDWLVILGHRNYKDGLWWDVTTTIPSSSQSSAPRSPTSTIPSLNAVLCCYNKLKSEVASYFHASCGSPTTKSTFIHAIKQGNFLSWPGLTANLISKHLPPSIATAKGHLTQEHQGL